MPKLDEINLAMQIADRLDRPYNMGTIADIVIEVFNQMARTLREGNRVEIRGFGGFWPKIVTVKRFHHVLYRKFVPRTTYLTADFAPGKTIREVYNLPRIDRRRRGYKDVRERLKASAEQMEDESDSNSLRLG